ncbi:MAG: hypothetical protein R3D34_01575 [Nitratireductor sp.]
MVITYQHRLVGHDLSPCISAKPDAGMFMTIRVPPVAAVFTLHVPDMLRTRSSIEIMPSPGFWWRIISGGRQSHPIVLDNDPQGPVIMAYIDFAITGTGMSCYIGQTFLDDPDDVNLSLWSNPAFVD